MSNTITGYAKVLRFNYLLGLDLDGITASTGTVSFINDNNQNNSWESVGSNDTTTETITITFSAAQTIDRIMAILQNWKEFNIQYDDSGWKDFSNVYSVAADVSAESDINYTDNSEATRYWEFTPVSTKQIRIQITKTFVVNEQKSCGQIYIGEEIGTFVNDLFCKPNKTKKSFQTGEKVVKLSNLGVYQIRRNDYGKYMAKIKIKGAIEEADNVIIEEMFDTREIAYMPSGADGTQYTRKGWRLRDIFNCIVRRDFTPDHAIGRDKDTGYSYKYDLMEV